MLRQHFTLFFQSLILSFIVYAGIHLSVSVFGQVMSSNNYSLQSDSVNFGGGYTTSGSYTLESTMGEVATGPISSDSYQLRAGYQQMQEIYLALSLPGAIELLPSIAGISGGTSTASMGVSVTTDNPAGYTLAISAENSPAMQSTNAQILDYAPSGATPDFTFTSAPNEAVFGFSPEGDDIAVRYQDNNSECGIAGGDSIESCWDGLSTTSRIIARGMSANHPQGATTTLRFQVVVGGMIAVPQGIYVATSTIIALPQ